MILVNQVDKCCMHGNTYENADRLRRVGAKFDNGAQLWRLDVAKHPMNNTKQKKKLEAMLTELEENGVRFILYMMDGSIR